MSAAITVIATRIRVAAIGAKPLPVIYTADVITLFIPVSRLDHDDRCNSPVLKRRFHQAEKSLVVVG